MVRRRCYIQIKILTAAIILLPNVGTYATAQQPTGMSSEATWYASYLRGGHLVKIPDGRFLNLYCIGAGSPVVVLESGIGGDAYDWRAVQDKIGKVTTVCAYDRAGLGRSSPGPLPRDTKAEVADLEALLRVARVPAPYVLVGHSMGGYNVHLFANRHLKDTAGIVMVDPSVQNQVPIVEAAVPAVAENDRKSVAFVRSCTDPQRTAEVPAHCVRSAPDNFPPELVAAYAAAHGPEFFKTFRSEVESFLSLDSQEVVAKSGQFGSIPLIVLTRGERSTNMPADQADTEWNIWNRMHDDLAKLSTAGINRMVPGANHYIQLDKPDAVVAAVEEVVGMARKQRTGHKP